MDEMRGGKIAEVSFWGTRPQKNPDFGKTRACTTLLCNSASQTICRLERSIYCLIKFAESWTMFW